MIGLNGMIMISLQILELKLKLNQLLIFKLGNKLNILI